MMRRMTPQDLATVSPAGHYIALRIGFAFPMKEINALPAPWVEHYTRNGLMLFDPIMRWAHTNTGTVAWSALRDDDRRGVLGMAAAFGLRFGLVAAVFDGNADGQRSFASFSRADREFTTLESQLLLAYLTRCHDEMLPPKTLTCAELEALAMVNDGKRFKQIAYDLGVTEGAVKQRLKNAKTKLHAKTSTEAAALARQFQLI